MDASYTLSSSSSHRTGDTPVSRRFRDLNESRISENFFSSGSGGTAKDIRTTGSRSTALDPDATIIGRPQAAAEPDAIVIGLLEAEMIVIGREEGLMSFFLVPWNTGSQMRSCLRCDSDDAKMRRQCLHGNVSSFMQVSRQSVDSKVRLGH